jgi:hypothetical protein
MEAEVSGHQRKVVSSSVAPVKRSLGDAGIPLRNGRTLPFRVTRAWNAPAGHYPESWYLVDPGSREVLFEGPTRALLVWGLQSWTEITDEVAAPIALRPGPILVVFALAGVWGGDLEIEAIEVPVDQVA